jgi:hypothetical protein
LSFLAGTVPQIGHKDRCMRATSGKTSPGASNQRLSSYDRYSAWLTEICISLVGCDDLNRFQVLGPGSRCLHPTWGRREHVVAV